LKLYLNEETHTILENQKISKVIGSNFEIVHPIRGVWDPFYTDSNPIR